MIKIAKNLYDYRELITALVWKNIVIRYKQAYLGILWAVLKPIMLMLIFTLVRSFVGIETGDTLYSLLRRCSLGYSFRNQHRKVLIASPPMLL
jgi:lipopolysaccharide transport system permease protein